MMDKKLHSDQKRKNTFYRYQSYKKIVMILVILSIIFSGLGRPEFTPAAVNVIVDYVNEIASVNVASGSSIRIYMSTDNKKTWEGLDYSVVDISTFMSTKDVSIFFKGNKDTDDNATELKILAEVSTLKVSYQIEGGIGRITYPTTIGPVEYRKGANGPWILATNSMATAIYEVRGATLYFRTPATTILRAGKIVSVKIPKRPAAPSVKLDGSKLCISGLKIGETQYRVGDAVAWTTFTSPISSTKHIDLSSLVAATTTSTTTPAAIMATTVEFRTFGSDKKVTSAGKVINIPVQPTYPDTIALTGSTLRITDTTKRTYEYTIVKKGDSLNMNTAKWTTATTKNAVIIPKVSVDDKILVRAKSYTDPTTKQLVLASTYKEIPVTSITTK